MTLNLMRPTLKPAVKNETVIHETENDAGVIINITSDDGHDIDNQPEKSLPQSNLQNASKNNSSIPLLRADTDDLDNMDDLYAYSELADEELPQFSFLRKRQSSVKIRLKEAKTVVLTPTVNTKKLKVRSTTFFRLALRRC
jgi:hypothetical protein